MNQFWTPNFEHCCFLFLQLDLAVAKMEYIFWLYNFILRIFFQPIRRKLACSEWVIQITYRPLLILAILFVDTFFNIDHIRFDKNVIFEQEKYETNQNTTCKNDNNNHLPIINIARFCKFLFLVRCKIWRCTRLFTVSTGTRSQT